MSDYDYDLFVIGAGSGGVRAARRAAGFGASVAVAEERYMGGTCVNVGCVPKKLMVYASHYAEDFEDAAAYGWSVGERHFDWSSFLANKNREILRLNRVYTEMLDDAGVQHFDGRAVVLDPHTVQVGDKRIRARYLLVAVGGWPRRPDIPGAELALTSNEIFHLSELPKRVLIVGGGYIAVEFAGILHGMGVAVTQIYRGSMFMRFFDEDVRTTLAEQMRVKGIDLRFEVNVDRLEPCDSGVRAHLTDDTTHDADAVLFAIGRDPKTPGLGLEQAGVQLTAKGAVLVDAYGKTSVDSIYAVGDVTDRIQLTPVALAEGTAVAATLFDGRPTRVDHDNVPSAVFSQPNVGTVGLSEHAARAEHDVVVYRSVFRPMKHTLTGRGERTMMKLVVDKPSDRLLGVHMVGPDAGEIIQGFAVAIKCGATKAQLDSTIGIHPTAAEELVTMRTPATDG
jgi:glutathione reductase (NADPH)